MPFRDDFDDFDEHASFDENSYRYSEAQRRDDEELAAIDECLDDASYEGEFDCLEDELDSVFADDEYWTALDAEYENVDEPA